MSTPAPALKGEAAYQLRFRSLFNGGRGYAFPCDAEGRVDLDALSPHALINYLYARTAVGREFSMPAVESPPAWSAARALATRP